MALDHRDIRFNYHIHSPIKCDSIDVHTRAINDARGRIMVLMTHNTDLGDSWEREGEDPGYFYQFSPPGYAVGLNVLVYLLTH
jgi:hypothetical protein